MKFFQRLTAPSAGLVIGLLVGVTDLLVLIFYPASRGTWVLPEWTWLSVPWLWMTVCCFIGTVLVRWPRLAAAAMVAVGFGTLLLSRVATPFKSATGLSSKVILLLWMLIVLLLAAPAFFIRLERARRAWLWLLACVVSFAFVFASATAFRPADWLSRDRTPQRASGQRNVVLVFLDTVRYDDAMTSMPRLARFRAEALTFDDAWAPAPWTTPSHFAVLTGFDPWRERADNLTHLYERHLPMLAERFKARGYATSAIFANPLLTTNGGFDRGYDEYTPSRDSGVCRSAIGDLLSRLWLNDAPRSPVCGFFLAPEVTGRAVRFLRRAQRPYFLTLNYLDVHDPYYVRPECRNPGFQPMPRAQRQAVIESLPAHPADPALVARAHGQYRQSLQCLDRSLGDLLDVLQRDPDYATTTIVFVGDHGEHFGEHGLGAHGNSVYSPVLRVPLIAKVPGNAPRRISDALSITDLHAALLQNLDTPSTPFRLLDRQRHRPVISDYLIEMPTGIEGGFSFVDDRFQYIRWNDGREAIFDHDGREVPVASQAAWAAPARDIVSRAKAMQLSPNEFSALGYLQ